MDSSSAFIGFLIGAAFVSLLHASLDYDSNSWKTLFKIKRLTPKIGDMYATYNNFYVEHWMTEDYTELFQVEFVGKKFVRLKSIEDNRSSAGGTSKGRVLDVEILSLRTRYQKYSGVKNKKTTSRHKQKAKRQGHSRHKCFRWSYTN